MSTTQVRMIVPPLSERQTNWDTIEFDKMTAPRIWVTMVIPGGKPANPKNASREKNLTMFTGVHKTRWLHEAHLNPSGIGERASRVRQSGACNLVIADNSDNSWLICALGECAAQKCVVQLAVVDNMEQLQSSRGFAVEGIISHYGLEDDCCYIRIQADAYCETTRPGLDVVGAAYTMGGNLIGKSYDYTEQLSVGTKRIQAIQKLLGNTLKILAIPQ